MNTANKNTVIDILLDRHCGGCEYAYIDNHNMASPGDDPACTDCYDIDGLIADLDKTKYKHYWEFLGFDDYCMYCASCLAIDKPFTYFKCAKTGKIFNTQLEKPNSSIPCPGFVNGSFIDLYKRNVKAVEEWEKSKK